tara:strand:+ start:1188 stop:1349 length:162 start_codon:yes stop_codon:yes gene_type:complete
MITNSNIRLISEEESRNKTIRFGRKMWNKGLLSGSALGLVTGLIIGFFIGLIY